MAIPELTWSFLNMMRVLMVAVAAAVLVGSAGIGAAPALAQAKSKVPAECAKIAEPTKKDECVKQVQAKEKAAKKTTAKKASPKEAAKAKQ